ncbi:MAG: type II secretion system protein GspL [Chromatiales bacterium]|nr:type II secretion system protein GspL [Chromatiales bacterium]
MQNSVYIRFVDESGSTVRWLTRTPQDGVQVRQGELREVALRTQGDRVTVLLPARALVPLRATLPPLQGQKLRRALPYAVEEQLADDVERYHLATGKRGSDGSLPLLAVGREQMARWQSTFAEAELRPHLCISEALALPWQPGEVTLLLEENGALVRLGTHKAYSLPLEGLEPLLELALGEADGEVTALRILDARGEQATQPPWQGELAQLEMRYECIEEPLKLLSDKRNGEVINLLQGEFSRREQLGKLWRPWRVTAALLAAWLLLMVGEALIDYRHLATEEERLYQAVEQLYRDTFPGAKNVVNPRAQMEQKLRELQGGSGGGDFVALMAVSAPVLSASKGTVLQNLRYRQGELELELQLADLPALDALKENLQGQGLAVEIRNATSRDNMVEGRLSLRRAGG